MLNSLTTWPTKHAKHAGTSSERHLFNFDRPRWAKEAFNRIGLCYRSGDSGCHSMDTEAPMKTRANGEKM